MAGERIDLPQGFSSRRSGVSASDSTYAIAPLRLFRFQIALIYLNAGLWKLLNPYWSDGSAVHYVLESNVYRRFPYELPVSFDALVPLLTYGTLFWELAFAPLVLFKRTRPVALAAGVPLHLGMLRRLRSGRFMSSCSPAILRSWIPEPFRRFRNDCGTGSGITAWPALIFAL